MKWLGWVAALLLVANGALYAYMQLNSARPGESLTGHEPIHGEKIRLVAATEKADQEKPKGTEQVADGQGQLCFDWSGFAAGDLDRASKELAKLQLTGRLAPLAAPSSYWVFIPPLKTLKDAEKKLEEVKQLGIEENIRIEEEGKSQFALNFGMFATEKEAAAYLEQLKNKGVKSAKTGRKADGNEIVGWHFQNVDDALAAQLAKMQSEYPGSSLKPSECSQ